MGSDRIVIIRSDGDYQLLIAQPDHAVLAERIISAWRRDGFPTTARRAVILYATQKHDDGWIDIDRSPLVDAASGQILDYVHAPDDVRRAIWPSGVERLAATPYAAALVAQHAIHLFDKYRADAVWRDFFVEMERSRDAQLTAAAPLTADDLLRDYFFVRLGDLLSLQFCDHWLEPQRHHGYETRWDGARLTIAPDPFEGAEVPLAVTARRLPRRTFSSPHDAAEAFIAAPRVAVTGIASGLA
jgi:hypothetical protein